MTFHKKGAKTENIQNKNRKGVERQGGKVVFLPCNLATLQLS
jgi:hypothetical protein